MTAPSRPPADRGPLAQRRLVVLSVVFAAAVFAACFWPLASGRFFLYGDLGNFHLPTRMFYAESLRNGTSPLWLPNLFCGFFLHAEGQVGMYHPLHWILYRLLPLPLALGLECTTSYPVAGIGMVLWLRRLALPTPAAICGGVAFGFSTFTLVRLTHVNVVAVVAHIPWLLWLADLSARSSRSAVRRNARAPTPHLIRPRKRGRDPDRRRPVGADSGALPRFAALR